MMSNQLVFNKYFRFYLHNKDLTTTNNTNSDFSVHIAFNGTGKNGNDYFINLIKNNGGSTPITITYNIEEIISYFELVYYMITKCNLTFNSNFTYTSKYVKSAVKKGFFALYAIQKLKNYQIQNKTQHYSENLELKKEKAEEKTKD